MVVCSYFLIFTLWFYSMVLLGVNMRNAAAKIKENREIYPVSVKGSKENEN